MDSILYFDPKYTVFEPNIKEFFFDNLNANEILRKKTGRKSHTSVKLFNQLFIHNHHLPKYRTSSAQ